MAELSIAVMQRYLKDIYTSEPITEQGLFMKLVEEVGETAEILNIRSGIKTGGGDITSALAAELADIMHCIVAIAAINNIDLSKAIIEKDKKATLKYRRNVSLEEFMLK